jgi:hypothetical protein
MLAACGDEPPNPAVPPRQLPEKPAWAAPVTTPAPKAGEFCTVVVKRERNAKNLVNARMTAFGDWYDNTVRKEFAQ